MSLHESDLKQCETAIKQQGDQCIQVGHTTPGVTLWYSSRLVFPAAEASRRRRAQPDHLHTLPERFSVLNSSTLRTKRQDAADDEGQHSLHGREGAGKGDFMFSVAIHILVQ